MKKAYKSPVICSSEFRMAIPAALVAGVTALGSAVTSVGSAALASAAAGAAVGASAAAASKVFGDDRRRVFPAIQMIES